MLLHHLVSCLVMSSTGFTDSSCGSKPLITTVQPSTPPFPPSSPPLLQFTDFFSPLRRECWSSGCLWTSINWPGVHPYLCSCRVNPTAGCSSCHHSGKWPRQHRLQVLAASILLSNPLLIHPYEQWGEWGKAARGVWSLLGSVVLLCSALPAWKACLTELTTQPFHQGSA